MHVFFYIHFADVDAEHDYIMSQALASYQEHTKCDTARGHSNSSKPPSGSSESGKGRNGDLAPGEDGDGVRESTDEKSPECGSPSMQGDSQPPGDRPISATASIKVVMDGLLSSPEQITEETTSDDQVTNSETSGSRLIQRPREARAPGYTRPQNRSVSSSAILASPPGANKGFSGSSHLSESLPNHPFRVGTPPSSNHVIQEVQRANLMDPERYEV